jgi:hypothetical protein
MQDDKRPIERLVLVYGADSGRLNALVDSAKKLLRVKGCSLCAITHGLAGERSEWRECREALGVPIDTYHRDEMPPDVAAALGAGVPAVLAQSDGGLQMLMGPEVLDRLQGGISDFRGRLLTHAAMKGLSLPAATDL